MAKKRPVVLSTRATRAEDAIVVAAAMQDGLVKSDFIHRAVLAAARKRLRMEQTPDSGAGEQ